MKKVQQGFTLIELMIVVAIIGILAAVALPAYNTYMVKSRITTVLGAVDGIRSQMAADIMEAQDVNSANQSQTYSTLYTTELAAVATNNKFVSAIAIDDATAKITITLATTNKLDKATGLKLLWTPTVNAGNVGWVCATTVPAADMDELPPACRNLGS